MSTLNMDLRITIYILLVEPCNVIYCDAVRILGVQVPIFHAESELKIQQEKGIGEVGVTKGYQSSMPNATL